MKKKLIATAVAGALALPAVTVAEEHTTFRVYGRVNNAIDYTKVQGASGQWGFRNVASRWGLQGSSDLGNGLTAVGRYEFFTYTNREGDNVIISSGGLGATNGRGGINDTRLGFVGLTGGFGSITIGNQWSAWFNTVGTLIDPTFTLATSGYVTGYFRTSNTIKYSNTFGPVYLDLDVRMANTGPQNDTEALGMNNGSDIDGAGLGLSFNVGENFTIAGAYDNDKRAGAVDDVEAIGIAAKGMFGNWGATLYYNEIDRGNTGGKTKGPGFWLSGGFGATSIQLGYGKADRATGGDADSWTLGVYHNMGAGFRIYFEGKTISDDSAVPDQDELLFGMRYDFSS